MTEAAEASSTCFAYKIETTPGVEAAGEDGHIIRRATGKLDLTKAEVTSREKRKDRQKVSFDHGTRACEWSIDSDLYGGDHRDFFAALLRRDFTEIKTASASPGDGFSISGGILTRANADNNFLADGLRIGQIGRLSGMSVADNNDRNFRIVDITPTTLSLIAVDGANPVADDTSTNESASFQIPGQLTFVPSEGHTSKSFTIERHDENTRTSHVGRGCQVGSFEMGVQPDSTPTVAFSGLGIDRRNVNSPAAPVIRNPSPVIDGPTMSSAIGFARINGKVAACITSLTLSVDLGIGNSSVAFSTVSCGVYYGPAAEVKGKISVLKESLAISDLFDKELEFELEFFIESQGPAPRSFVSVFMPRVKLSSESENDPEGQVVQSADFMALKPLTGDGIELSSIMIQDSSVVRAV